MNAPKIMGMRGMFQSRGFPTGALASKAGRMGSLVVWAKPADKRRVRVVDGARVIPNRGDVFLRGR